MKQKLPECSIVNTNAAPLKTLKFKVTNTRSVMMTLAKMYSNPIQTLVQEYLCNGRDATRAAKSKKPLLVTLPTDKRPTLIIRDYGTGLTETDVSEIFISFGESSKRNDDSQTGTHGIGAKSYFAYGDQFTVITHVDGKARHYIAVRDNGDGEPALLLHAEGDSVEPNGTEIQLPFKSNEVEAVLHAVERATCFWDVKPEFVKTAIAYPDARMKAGIIEFYGSIDALPSRHSYRHEKEFYLAVDGVPYPLDDRFEDVSGFQELKERLKGSGSSVVILHCGNSDVYPTPSREALVDDKETKGAVSKLLKKAQADMTVAAREVVKAETTLKDFLSMHSIVNDVFAITEDLTFKDKSDGITYEVNPFGWIVKGLPEGVKCFDVQKEKREKLLFSEREASRVKMHRMFYTDAKISQRGVCIRLAAACGGSDSSYAGRVLTHDNPQDAAYLAFVKKIDARSIYDVYVEKASPKSQKTNENQAMINVYRGEGVATVSQMVELTTNEKTWVYVIKGKDNADTLQAKYKALADSLEKMELGFCLVAENRSAKVVADSKFVSVENFFADLEKYVGKKHFEAMEFQARQHVTEDVREKFEPLLRAKAFQDSVSKLKDKAARATFAELAKIQPAVRVHSWDRKPKTSLVDGDSGVVEAVMKLRPDVKRLKNETAAMLRCVEKNYAMLLSLNYYDKTVAKLVPEVVAYMNCKFSQGLKD